MLVEDLVLPLGGLSDLVLHADVVLGEHIPAEAQIVVVTGRKYWRRVAGSIQSTLVLLLRQRLHNHRSLVDFPRVQNLRLRWDSSLGMIKWRVSFLNEDVLGLQIRIERWLVVGFKH